MSICKHASCPCKNLYTDWAIGQRSGLCEDCGYPKTDHFSTQTHLGHIGQNCSTNALGLVLDWESFSNTTPTSGCDRVRLSKNIDNSKMSCDIIIVVAGKVLPCAYGRSVGWAEAKIRERFTISGGSIDCNGVAADGNDLIEVGKAYQFVGGSFQGTTKIGSVYLPIQPVHVFEVNDIPQVFLDAFADKRSVHASSILNYSSVHEQAAVMEWIKDNVVSPQDFELDHDHSIPTGATNTFSAQSFEALGYAVWDIGFDATMTCRAKFVQRDDVSRVFDLSGRADYIITHRTTPSGVVTTKADLLTSALCIIQVQSKHHDKDIPMCEIQLQLYLLLAMNLGGLPAAVGFLVQDDGMCRTYRATRQPAAIMYEQNDLVHVSHLADVMQKVLAEM